MDGDEGLILCPLHGPQVSCGHVNQSVEQIQEELVGFGHNAFIVSRVGQRLLCVPRPYYLNPQQANLDQVQEHLVINYQETLKDCFCEVFYNRYMVNPN